MVPLATRRRVLKLRFHLLLFEAKLLHDTVEQLFTV